MRSYVEISRSRLLANYRQFKSIVPASHLLYAVVKGNAYGHGLKEVVSVLERDADGFCVEDAQELRALRKVTRKHCLVLGHVSEDELDGELIPQTHFSLFSWEQLPVMKRLSEKYGRKIEVQIKIDALLGRQGFLVDETQTLTEILHRSIFVEVKGVYSHLSTAKQGDVVHAHQQIRVFTKAVDTLRQHIPSPLLVHINASGGLVYLNPSQFSASRLGAGMYGIWPIDERLRPALRWMSGITQVKTVPEGYPIGYDKTYTTTKPTKIAVVPQGFSDGYDRQLSNRGFVLIRGTRCKILGRVSMNVCVVDVTHLGEVQVGDEVVLLGEQGAAEITVHDLAAVGDTNSYEIVARISPLLERVIV